MIKVVSPEMILFGRRRLPVMEGAEAAVPKCGTD